MLYSVQDRELSRANPNNTLLMVGESNSDGMLGHCRAHINFWAMLVVLRINSQYFDVCYQTPSHNHSFVDDWDTLCCMGHYDYVTFLDILFIYALVP